MDSSSPHVNPYIAGSPVTRAEMFFGREDVFSDVRKNLIGRHGDTPVVLYGQRRTGKTSVLYQMNRYLGPRYRCILIDLHGLDLHGIESFLWGVANSIRRGLKHDYQLSIAVPDRVTFSANPYAEFEDTFLDTVWSLLGEDHLVLMFDEAVRLYEEVQAGRLERNVFDYLRHLMQHFERLNFIFSLGSGLEEMEKDYHYLFSVALYQKISFLNPAAARALISKPVQGCYRVMPGAVERILQITSGQPYYMQLICHCLFDRWLATSKTQMTAPDVDAVTAEAIELGSANLTYVWEESTPEEKATIAGMAATMRDGGHAATTGQIQQAWSTIGVSLPAGELATAVRSLSSREVVVSSHEAHTFAVDLQRIWLDKHRHLDWVKEELGEAAQEWAAKARAPAAAKPPPSAAPAGQPSPAKKPRTRAPAATAPAATKAKTRAPATAKPPPPAAPAGQPSPAKKPRTRPPAATKTPARAPATAKAPPPAAPADEPSQVKKTRIPAPAVDVPALAEELRLWYEAQRLEATMAVTPTGLMVQCRTRRTLKRAFGMGVALTVILSREGEQLLVEIGPAKWRGKGAAAGAGLAGAGLGVAAAPVAAVVWVAVGIGAWRQYRLPKQTITFLREKATTHVSGTQGSHASPSRTRRGPRQALRKPGEPETTPKVRRR